MRTMNLLKVIIIFTLFSSVAASALECARSLDRLEQLTHLSSGSQLFPQHLEDRLLGRFKSSKGFYVYEYESQLYLGIDGGFLLGKRSYPLTVCPMDNGWLFVQADFEGRRQTVNVRMIKRAGRAALELTGGKGKLSGFNGVYPRKNMSMQDILKMFGH